MPVLHVVVELAHVEPLLLRHTQLAETVLLAPAPLANVAFIGISVHIEANSVLFVAARLALVRLVGSVRLDHEVTAA